MAAAPARLGRWRKAPVQGRVDDTLRALFEATAQLLQSEGIERLSTNRIAARAGFAVGTLYQYFPNKQELLVAMAEDELERGLQTLDARARDCTGLPRPQAVRALVGVWLQAFGGRHRVMGEVIQALEGQRPAGELQQRFAPAARQLASHLLALPPGPGAAASAELHFVLGQALLSTVRAALLQDPTLLSRPAFEDALVQLALGLLPGE